MKRNLPLLIAVALLGGDHHEVEGGQAARGAGHDAALEHHEAHRQLALERVVDADDGAFGDVGVGGQDPVDARRVEIRHPRGVEPGEGDPVVRALTILVLILFETKPLFHIWFQHYL